MRQNINFLFQLQCFQPIDCRTRGNVSFYLVHSVEEKLDLEFFGIVGYRS